MFQKLTFLSLVGVAVLQGCAQTNMTNTPAHNLERAVDTPKNIIMVVADGMGPAYTTAYRNYADNPATPAIEHVVFDDILTGNASTYPARVSGYVTDSAAAATALATGVKSYNGAISVDENKLPVETVLELAKTKGMRTGVAVTSQVNHATPAAYLSHNESRQNYNAIADSYFDARIDGNFVADVILGGGTQFFERKDRDLVAQFIDADYAYVDTYNKLATLPAGANVLGLFAPVGLPPALDDSRAHRLAYLTEHAIKHLENDQGYFLLVEASQVDWAGHANDIGSAMAEMADLAATIEYLKSYVSSHPDTLVVLTADHSTGGLSIGANDKYEWSPEYLRSMKASVATIARNVADMDQPLAYVSQQLGFALSEEDNQQLQKIVASKKVAEREAGLKQFLDNKTNTGWTSGGHTGVDVEVFAFGAGSHAFTGQLDNIDIGNTMKAFIQGKAQAMSTQPDPKNSAGDSQATRPCDFKEDWRCL